MMILTIGEAHLKSPSPKLARPMPIGHWAGSGKLGQIRACNGRPFLAGFRIGRAWAVMGPMGLGSGARSSYMTLKFDIFKQFLARKAADFFRKPAKHFNLLLLYVNKAKFSEFLTLFSPFWDSERPIYVGSMRVGRPYAQRAAHWAGR